MRREGPHERHNKLAPWRLDDDWEGDIIVERHQLALLTRQLSLMLSAGISLRDAFEVLAHGVADESMKVLLARLIREVESGQPFSTAAKIFPRVFTRVYVAMIKAGEETGRLVATLSKVADWLDYEQALLKNIKKALTYPVIVLGVGILLTTLFFVVIYPAFSSVFSQQESLPLLTRALSVISATLRSGYFWFLTPILISLLLRATQLTLSRPSNRSLAWAFLVRTPLGSVLVGISAGRFASAMALLLHTGVDVLTSFRMASDASGSPQLLEEVEEGLDHLRQGGNLAEFTKARPKIFPPITTGLLVVGQESAKLPEMFGSLAQILQDDTEHRVETFINVLEPIMIGLVGFLVAILLVGVSAPMYSLTAGI
jgi:type II secretory pathway component PulF